MGEGTWGHFLLDDPATSLALRALKKEFQAYSKLFQEEGRFKAK